METKTQSDLADSWRRLAFRQGRLFWKQVFDSGESDGVTIRIGNYRCSQINEMWGVMEIGGAYPFEVFSSRQGALDCMVERTLNASGKY
jgi:hypothetical protein